MKFDRYIEAPFTIPPPEDLTLGDLIYSTLPHRNENSTILLSHIEDRYIEITLKEFRFIVSELIKKFSAGDLKPGDTVMLASLQGSNEVFSALYFAALASMGLRCFIPIFPELKDFEEWICKTGTKAIICPFAEIQNLKGYDREKEIATEIRKICSKRSIGFLDSLESFGIVSLIETSKKTEHDGLAYNNRFNWVKPEMEATVVTTSGSTGKSKLVVYTHRCYILNCLAWQQAGLYHPAMLGNTTFTPLFNHTIGIRNFVNAIWLGEPCCVIISDWFHLYPEKVRYFLLKMKPSNIVGGPAMFNALLEIYRYFPELKDELNKHLKTLVSIGAPYNAETAAKLKSATGVPLYNAFGTTETQMVSISLTENVNGCTNNLGELLPGVKIGLKKLAGNSQFYQLYVSSPFQSARVIGERANGSYHSTGDLVTLHNGNIIYHSRQRADFLKDDFGVKLPIADLKKYYNKLYHLTDHIEWIPLKNKPGLSALLFMKKVADSPSLEEMGGVVKSINCQLRNQIEPFEYNHRSLQRVSIINDNLPLTRKGTVSSSLIMQLYEPLIEDLRNPLVINEKIMEVEGDNQSTLFHQYVNPDLGDMLNKLNLDVSYHLGKGDHLYCKWKGREIAVLDLAGGFGSNLVGHNHPAIKKAVIDFLEEDKVALNNQGSIQSGVAILAEKLNKILGQKTNKLFKVQFGTSGAEAMEIALHHAYFEWRKKIERLRDSQVQLFGASADVDVTQTWNENMKEVNEVFPSILAINKCFHGYTSGARSLLNGNKKTRNYFSGLLKLNTLIIDDKATDWIETINNHVSGSSIQLKRVARLNGKDLVENFKISSLIASVIEPVRGEGGVSPINPDVADYLAHLDFPLISDEIQCGLGRTGSIPAYNKASYYLFGKALGGGIEKISAVMIDGQRFQNEFPKYYSTTFSNGDLAATVASSTIDLILRDGLPRLASEKGRYIKDKLRTIKNNYPQVISAIEGEGLMLGIFLNAQVGTQNVMLRVFYEQELLGHLFSAWLFTKYRIRIFPSLSNGNSLRIEPSCYISEADVSLLCQGLEDICKLAAEKKLYELLGFLMDDDQFDDRNAKDFDGLFPDHIEEPAPGARRIGFISHFVYPLAELKLIEPDLHRASDTGLRILFNKMQLLFQGKPVKIISKNLLNDKIHFTFYLLPFDSAQLENAHKWGKKKNFIKRVQEAADLLVAQNVSHISLGAYASILTNNGLQLAAPGACKIVTGNTLTVASCIHHFETYLTKVKPGNRPLTIAIVGANGNIGSAIASCITESLPEESTLMLVGTTTTRVSRIANSLKEKNPMAKIESDDDLFSLEKADVIICCTNTNDPVIFPHHVNKSNPVFVIDISVPSGVACGVRCLPNVNFSKGSGFVNLPGNEDLFSSHTPPGGIFCCAGEVMLDGLYKTKFSLKGRLETEAVNAFMQMAREQSFFKI